MEHTYVVRWEHMVRGEKMHFHERGPAYNSFFVCKRAAEERCDEILEGFSVDADTGECYEIPEGTKVQYKIFSIWYGFEGALRLARPIYG